MLQRYTTACINGWSSRGRFVVDGARSGPTLRGGDGSGVWFLAISQGFWANLGKFYVLKVLDPKHSIPSRFPKTVDDAQGGGRAGWICQRPAGARPPPRTPPLRRLRRRAGRFARECARAVVLSAEISGVTCTAKRHIASAQSHGRIYSLTLS